jgi:hypothetical protein
MSLTREQAVAVAKAYVAAKPILDGTYRCTLERWRQVTEGWYFDFTYERVDGRPLSITDAVFGAPGYIVSSSDGEVRVVARKEWMERHLGRDNPPMQRTGGDGNL